MTTLPLLILGAGTFAVEVLEAAELSGQSVLGFVVTDDRFRTGPTLETLPVHNVEEVPHPPGHVLCVAGIVSTKRRALVEEMARRGYAFASVRHPRAIVSPRAVIEAGVFIGAGAIVSAHTRVGPHTVLNRGANVAHDVALDAYATVGPNAVVAGAVSIGARAWIGVGAVVRDHLDIGEGAVVGAGALVVKPVPAHTLVTGSPAVVVREGVDGL